MLALAWWNEPEGNIEWLSLRLAEAFPGHSVSPTGVYEPPPEAYNPERGQLVSPMVLARAAELKRALGADALLYVVGADAYSPGLNFVFGEALLGGGAAVVYTARLRLGAARSLYLERLLKEALHELGHGFGLEHCRNPRCVMRFSNSLAEVDEKEPRFCRSCAAELSMLGVEVSPAYVLPE